MDRKLVFSFYGKDVSAGRTMHGIAGQTDTLRSRSLAAAKAVGVLAGGAALAGLTATLKTGFNELSDYQGGLSQLRAGLKSTHGAAGLTAKGMENLASKIEGYSGQTDDSIVKAEAQLITFPKVRNELGKNNDVFTQAIELSADYAQRTGRDSSQAAIMFGKALNDPIRGLTALGRVGIQFDDQQRAQITRLAEHNHVLKAQKIILGELDTEYQGSARAFGKTLPGQLARTERAYEGIAQELATDLLPYALDFTKWVRKDALPALEDFGGWIKSHKTQLEWFAGIFAGAAISIKALKGVRSLQALVGRGPLGGGGGLLGSAASMARPIPVYVTNAGIPGVGGGVPVGGTVGKASKFGRVARAIPVVGSIAVAAGGAFSVTQSENAKTAADFARLAAAGGKSLADLKKNYLNLADAAEGMSGIQKTVTDKVLASMKSALDSVGALDDAAFKAGNGIGTDLGRGLIAGIEQQVPHSTYAGKILVQQTVKQMRLAADAHSPSRVTERLGKDLADGLVNGFVNVRAFDKLAVETRHGLMQLSRTTQNAMAYRSGVRSSLQDFASLSGRGAQTDSFGSSMGSQSTRAYLRGKVQRLREFRDLLDKLERKGASPALLAEYEEIGPDAVPEMRADLHTGRKGIHRINRLEHRANRLAGQVATSATETAYGDQLTHEVQRLPHKIAHALAHELKKDLHFDVHLTRLSKHRGRAVRNKS